MPLAKRRTAPAWTQEAWARYAQLEGRLRDVRSDERDAIVSRLARAQELLEDPVPSGLRARLSNWWNGDRIERAWTWLEQTEIDIVAASTDRGLRIALGIAVQRAENALPGKDPARVALDALAGIARENPEVPLATAVAKPAKARTGMRP